MLYRMQNRDQLSKFWIRGGSTRYAQAVHVDLFQSM